MTFCLQAEEGIRDHCVTGVQTCALPISSLAFGPDGKTLASASGDQTIRFWDVTNQKQISLLRGHLDEVYSLAFSPDRSEERRVGTECWFRRRPEYEKPQPHHTLLRSYPG